MYLRIYLIRCMHLYVSSILWQKTVWFVDATMLNTVWFFCWFSFSKTYFLNFLESYHRVFTHSHTHNKHYSAYFNCSFNFYLISFYFSKGIILYACKDSLGYLMTPSSYHWFAFCCCNHAHIYLYVPFIISPQKHEFISSKGYLHYLQSLMYRTVLYGYVIIYNEWVFCILIFSCNGERSRPCRIYVFILYISSNVWWLPVIYFSFCIKLYFFTAASIIFNSKYWSFFNIITYLYIVCSIWFLFLYRIFTANIHISYECTYELLRVGLDF